MTVDDRIEPQESEQAEPQSDVDQQVGGRRARTDVARTMVLAAVVSILVIGGFNLFQARTFLTEEAEGLLIDIGAARGTALERGLEQLVSDVETIAADRGVGEAIVGLSNGYGQTTQTLDDGQLAELRAFYDDEVASYRLPGTSGPVGDAYFPTSERSQYLQYWYIANNPNEDRSELVDPGDGSRYSIAHANYHPRVVATTESTPVGDLLLIDLNGEIVYSTDKRIDFATSVFSGPFADTAVGRAISDLRSSAAGQVRVVDFTPYPPAGGGLEFWVVSLVRIDDEVVGALAGSIPNSVLTELTTGGGAWEEDGLGETGEVYIVGPDMLLRSESRLWLEDPEEYLKVLESAGYPPELIDDIRTFGTTVMLQPVDTEPVQSALGGEIFTGNTRNYLDRRTLSAAGPLRPGNLGWLVVSEVERGQLTAGFSGYLLTLLVALVIILAIVVLVAFVAARRLLEPIGPIGAAASSVGQGDLDVELFDEGRDEFAYLSREFNSFVDELRIVRAEAEKTEAETSELLQSVVPSRLVDRILAGGRGITEALSDATIVSITLRGDLVEGEAVDEIASQQSHLTAGIASLAREHGAELLSSTAAVVLYATGLDVEGRRVSDGVEFAASVDDWVHTIDDRDLNLALSFGIASGDVVTGVMGAERLAVDVIGAPRQIAMDLSSAAQPEQILVGADTASRLGPEWRVERIDGLTDVSGAPLDAWSVHRSGLDGEPNTETDQ